MTSKIVGIENRDRWNLANGTSQHGDSLRFNELKMINKT